ncbi:MAG: ATP-dependent Lon protease, partial [Pyrinomonadaceae bacterium]|nr:ATP-dependent Lon protease [Pyrinomonadaceae bacterium]
KGALAALIQQYTQEAGLRQLEREIGSICRKVARRIAEGSSDTVHVTPKNLHEFLGSPKVMPDEVLKKDQIGVATGLAWTATGGEVLFIEALRMKGKGALVLTGQLGDVMKESAQAAYSYAKSRARELGIPEDDFNLYDVHVHIPEGAIPKDGPSAGITLATAIVSVLAQRPIRKDVAMTGEITLRGNVLPVGGVKEKVLAARRARVTKILLPHLNQRDMDEVPKELFGEIQFIFVDNVQQVFREALKDKVTPPASGSARPKPLTLPVPTSSH